MPPGEHCQVHCSLPPDANSFVKVRQSRQPHALLGIRYELPSSQYQTKGYFRISLSRGISAESSLKTSFTLVFRVVPSRGLISSLALAASARNSSSFIVLMNAPAVFQRDPWVYLEAGHKGVPLAQSYESPSESSFWLRLSWHSR